MKRNFVVASVAALVLALALSASAMAGVGAEASAKPAAKKGKACKKKTGQKKAGRSASSSVKPKKKGKACKGKTKNKGGKGADGGKGTPAGPPPPAATPLGDGTYGDAANLLELSISGGATSVVLKYVPPGGCVAINYTSQPVTLTKSGDTWTANETRDFSLVGTPAHVKWDLTIKEPGLTYALNLTLESEPDILDACKWEGHPTGTLAKVG